MNELTSIISNVGFPIFACIIMFQQQKELNKAITDLSSTLKSIDARIDIKQSQLFLLDNSTLSSNEIYLSVALLDKTVQS